MKGVKLQVLDENDKPLPTAEFICHFNIDGLTRDKVFPHAEKSGDRIFTLTQGQTEFHFPDGYAVPVASNEKWKFTFQAANRTTNEHRRIKHLLTVDFVKDSDLTKPMVALSYCTPYIAVVVDKNTNSDMLMHHDTSCLAVSSSTSAPNSVPGSTLIDSHNRTVSGHWAVPPGVHDYSSPITDDRDPGFNSKDRIVHAVWSHMHPLCRQASFLICDGSQKTPLWTVNVKTNTDHGLEIKHIDSISSKEGIRLPAGKQFEMASTYDNVTGITQDSMVSEGLFYEDSDFKKPDWTNLTVENTPSSDDYGGQDRYDPFDPGKDGPLLSTEKTIEVATTAGKLHLNVDPDIAPETATQMYHLFTKGAFDGTALSNFMPGYLVQVGSVEFKHDLNKKVPEEVVRTMRRLPLEVDGQDSGKGLHKQWALTMSRNAAEDSAVSAFSIMLKDAPHLNHEYTVFGTLVPDDTTLATMNRIARRWNFTQSYITSAKEISHIKYSVVEKDGTKQERICTDLYCGIKPPEKIAKPEYEQYPPFKEKTDGPLLSQNKNLEIKTSAGNIHIVIEPSLAPINATQMYHLFHSGVFDGTLLTRYEPNFVLQTGLADTKVGPPALSLTRKALLRNLPLEVASQAKGQGLHKKFALSMAHADDPNSASSSFSILLGSAPHLDHKYTVFGHACDDAETIKTLTKIEDEWARQSHILSAFPKCQATQSPRQPTKSSAVGIHIAWDPAGFRGMSIPDRFSRSTRRM